ncbi:MAG: antitoxin [Candidatus Dormiibacterota bacterium]
MPRTTLDLDAWMLRELRRRGQRQRKSMGVVASELLAGALADSDLPPQGTDFRWASADLGNPLVDLEDKDALLSALDRRA